MSIGFRPLLALCAATASLGQMAACANGGNVNDFTGKEAGDSGTRAGDGATGLGGDGGIDGASEAAGHDEGGDRDAGRKPDGDGGAADSGLTIDAKGGNTDAAPGIDGSAGETGSRDTGAADTGALDSGVPDAGVLDTGIVTADTGIVTGLDSGTVNIVTGGPCLSGAAGATAIRIGWFDAGGEAVAQLLAEGLPDTSQDYADANGYQIGFTPSYVDPYLAQGGVLLDDTDFIDILMTTNGITNIANATIAVYGRSFDTVASGSFNWQTFDGIGQTPVDYVSNAAPYQWYPADMTTEIGPGETQVRIRVKAGLSSDSLVVNQLEICMVAN